MNIVSISQLKANPSKVITDSGDYPVAVSNRNKIKAYMVGKDLYEKMVGFLEDMVDKKAVKSADLSQGRDFEEVAEELGI